MDISKDVAWSGPALDPIPIVQLDVLASEYPATTDVAGDYNGIVDMADYVVWHKGLGTTYTQTDYNTWRANFGQPAGSGSAASADAAVPEPATMAMLIVGLLVMPFCRRAAMS